MEKNNPKTALSRRKFVGNSAAAAAAFTILPSGFYRDGESAPAAMLQKAAKPNSKFGGVQIGAITYSWRSMPGGIDNIIKYCIESGISSIELMSGDLETYLGAPANPMAGMFRPPQGAPQPGQAQAQPGAQGQGQGQARGQAQGQGQQQGQPGGGGQPAGGQRPGGRQLTPEQQEAVNKYNAQLKEWRLALPMSKLAPVKKMFDDAGIGIHIVKYSPGRWSDEEIDYAFRSAKALGAKGVCDEIGDEAVKKMAPIAAKNGMYAIFHNHMQFATEGFSYDPFLAVSPAVMMNFDAGHFFGSTGIHPNTIIEKYHDRIFSVHLKDKTGPKTDPANMNQVWGQGEAPIADVLNLIKKNKWPMHCDIELEYEIKPWSNAVKETRTCVQYARNILI